MPLIFADHGTDISVVTGQARRQSCRQHQVAGGSPEPVTVYEPKPFRVRRITGIETIGHDLLQNDEKATRGSTIRDINSAGTGMASAAAFGLFHCCMGNDRELQTTGADDKRRWRESQQVGECIVKSAEGSQETGFPAFKRTTQALEAIATVDIGKPVSKGKHPINSSIAIEGARSAQDAIATMTWGYQPCNNGLLCTCASGFGQCFCLLSLSRALSESPASTGPRQIPAVT